MNKEIIVIKHLCPVCKSTNSNRVRIAKDTNHFIEGNWMYSSCEYCSASYLIDPPSETEISKYYPANSYFTHNPPSEDSVLLTKIYNYYYLNCFSVTGLLGLLLLGRKINMFPKLDRGKENVMLDFGCGNGSLMKRYRSLGFNCEGYDVDDRSLKYVRDLGFKTYSGSICSIPAQKKFDVIILNQVLEHMHKPYDTLKFLKDRLKSDGELIISVPNKSCIDFHLLKDSWSCFQAPTHIVHFNKNALSILLSNLGFTITKIRYSTSLGTIKKSYIRSNLKKLFRNKGISVNTLLVATTFIMTSLLSLIPILSKLRRIRITVYAIPTMHS
jgi:2-polyprenyl-3-methyl-5-hydroxy-6-metoxy-1,4-benzoquinol methylase